MKKQKPKPKPKPKYELYLAYRESASWGGLCPGEEGEYACREDSYIEFTPISIHSKMSGSQHTLITSFDPALNIGKVAYLVVVRYCDGDTFGTTMGNWDIPVVTLDYDFAASVATRIEGGVYLSPRGYNPWEGYFAGLESVAIAPRQIMDTPCGGISLI